MTTAQTGGRCVACHVLSRDGKDMLVTYDGGDHVATTVDVATATPAPPTNMWNFASFTPDGSEFLAVSQGTLVVRRFADQSIVATMPASGWVTHPDLSPDGKMLVYVHPNANTGISDWNFQGGSLFVRSYDVASHTFGPEQQLVSTGDNNYYPSFSPDGQWIVFNRSSSGTAYNNANATLWVVKADNSLAPMQLATASSMAGRTDSWGRWAPFAQTFGANDEKMFWVTVSSKRDFGVRLVGANRPQIWMAPFFPERAAQAQDPCAPPFRLPFQAIESNNHIAQWTQQVVNPQ
jgi:TolB protein